MMRDVIDHLPAIERGRRGGAEYVLEIQIMAVVHFLAAAVQMAQHRREIDSRGIHQLLLRKIEGGADGQ